VIGCALIPRFALTVAIGERRELLGQPVALAPQPGSPQVVGEVSGAAGAFGIAPGMGLGEALGRCPELALVPSDPERAEAAWEETLVALEGIGAAVESERAGEAFFETSGLRGLWGGETRVLERARRAIALATRLGAGPTRLCAAVAALRFRPRRPGRFVVIGERTGRAFLASQPVSLLRDRLEGEWERATLPPTVERLGIRTLGELAALPDDAIADRFGEPGLAALAIARAAPERLRPRRPREDVAELLELPESASGPQLERSIELLVDRLLANPRRRGRSIRRLRLWARLTAGGGWRADATLRSPSADPIRLRLALAPKLTELPAPASAIGLRALALGPAGGEQPALTRDERERRRARIGEAVRQARAAAGAEAVMRVLEVDPASRVPERRTALTPYPEVEARE
jgi:protein ImuB